MKRAETCSCSLGNKLYTYLYHHIVVLDKYISSILACTAFDGLMQTLNIKHNPLGWWIFIDSFKLSLKTVLPHNGNTLPSIPVGHSVFNKELYENMKILMEAINYDEFKWRICSDIKWLRYYLNNNNDSQNIAASFVNGTAELSLFITQERIGLPENLWNQESWIWKINH